MLGAGSTELGVRKSQCIEQELTEGTEYFDTPFSPLTPVHFLFVRCGEVAFDNRGGF